jgi:C4-dicarboxylate-specific signal transduction histidine kinase
VDPDIVWHSLGGGAIIAAALALARLLLDYGLRGGERRTEHDERRQRQQRDAEARLERILQDRLADADRRLERFEQEAYAERVRAASLEHEHARLMQAYELLKDQYLALQAEYARLARGH